MHVVEFILLCGVSVALFHYLTSDGRIVENCCFVFALILLTSCLIFLLLMLIISDKGISVNHNVSDLLCVPFHTNVCDQTLPVCGKQIE